MDALPLDSLQTGLVHLLGYLQRLTRPHVRPLGDTEVNVLNLLHHVSHPAGLRRVTVKRHRRLTGIVHGVLGGARDDTARVADKPPILIEHLHDRVFVRLVLPPAPLVIEEGARLIKPVHNGGSHECGLSNAGVNSTSIAASVASVSTLTGNSTTPWRGMIGFVNRDCFIS